MQTNFCTNQLHYSQHSPLPSKNLVHYNMNVVNHLNKLTLMILNGVHTQSLASFNLRNDIGTKAVLFSAAALFIIINTVYQTELTYSCLYLLH